MSLTPPSPSTSAVLTPPPPPPMSLKDGVLPADFVPHSLPPPHRNHRRRGGQPGALFRPRSRTDPRDLKLPMSLADPPVTLSSMRQRATTASDSLGFDHVGLGTLRPIMDVAPTSPVRVQDDMTGGVAGATAPYIHLPAASPVPKSATDVGQSSAGARLAAVPRQVAGWFSQVLTKPFKRGPSSYKSVNSISDSVSVGGDSVTTASEFYKPPRRAARRHRKGLVNTLWTYAHRLHILLTIVVLVFLVVLVVNHVPHLLRVISEVDHTAKHMDKYLKELDKIAAFIKQIEGGGSGDAESAARGLQQLYATVTTAGNGD